MNDYSSTAVHSLLKPTETKDAGLSYWLNLHLLLLAIPIRFTLIYFPFLGPSTEQPSNHLIQYDRTNYMRVKKFSLFFPGNAICLHGSRCFSSKRNFLHKLIGLQMNHLEESLIIYYTRCFNLALFHPQKNDDLFLYKLGWQGRLAGSLNNNGSFHCNNNKLSICIVNPSRRRRC